MTGPPGLAIRTITAEADLERFVRIINATNPESPTSLDEIRWSNATYPGTVRFLAEVDRTTLWAPPRWAGSTCSAPNTRRCGR